MVLLPGTCRFRPKARIDEAQAEKAWPALLAWIDSALLAEVMETSPGWRDGEVGPTFMAQVSGAR